jgi:hypothetical protein
MAIVSVIPSRQKEHTNR